MSERITLHVNGIDHELPAGIDPETPLLTVLRNDLGLKGPKFGCGLEQCNACKVLIDGADVPSCEIPIARVAGLAITTVEGLGTPDNPHPLQEAFVEEQAIQCGYCASGMIIAAQGLLNRVRYPTDDEIRAALADNICRCGVYERVRRAIKMRIGRPIWEPIYEVVEGEPIPDPPVETDGPLPASLVTTPELDRWVRINPGGTITIYTGKVEYGQGIQTAVAQIAAEELDVDLARIEVAGVATGAAPDEGATVGSLSLETTGRAVRQAAAEARQHLLDLAFEELEAETPAAGLLVADGTITDPATGRQTTYWDLFAGRRFERPVTGAAAPKPAAAHRLVGRPETRLDLLAKVTGQPSYLHDLELPGMVYGRVLRPPAYDGHLVSFDEAAVRALPGVIAVVRDGRFLAVIAEREEQAVRALAAMKEQAVWDNRTALPPQEQLYDYMLAQPSRDFLVDRGTATTDPIPPRLEEEPGDRVLAATYYRPYHMHGSLGPSAAAALFQDGRLTVWAQTQGVYPQQAALAAALAMEPDDIEVIYAEGSGCYGHNGADDAAFDAALLALALPGRPVALQWMREDEHGWEPYGSAMVVKLQAALDEAGAVRAWNHDVWSFAHTTRSRPGAAGTSLVAAWHRAEPIEPFQPGPTLGNNFGEYRNADPLYAFPNRRIVTHFLAGSPLRTSSLRSLGAYANVFAIESFMDELAAAAGVDPVEFRLRHLADKRARAVVEAAAARAGWEPRTWPAGEGRGRGIAFARYKNRQAYAAIVVDLEVDRTTGAIQMKRAVIAADAGQIVNPDGLSNQLEGGFIQAASWTLHEAVAFDESGVRSQDWDGYPILRATGVPELATVLISRPEQPFLGSGEGTQPPAPAAIANAVYDAVGVRLREIPFTPDRVLAALAAGERG